MKSLDFDPTDVYEGKHFALSAIGRSFVNLSVEGLHEPLNRSEDGIHYSDGVWVSMYDTELDELITALQYYREYRTFKKVEEE